MAMTPLTSFSNANVGISFCHSMRIGVCPGSAAWGIVIFPSNLPRSFGTLPLFVVTRYIFCPAVAETTMTASGSPIPSRTRKMSIPVSKRYPLITTFNAAISFHSGHSKKQYRLEATSPHGFLSGGFSGGFGPASVMDPLGMPFSGGSSPSGACGSVIPAPGTPCCWVTTLLAGGFALMYPNHPPQAVVVANDRINKTKNIFLICLSPNFPTMIRKNILLWFIKSNDSQKIKIRWYWQ